MTAIPSTTAAIAPSAARPGAPSTAPSSAPSTATGHGTGALGSLSSNFNTFLSLLMTQLKNQNPTSPLDSSRNHLPAICRPSRES